MARRLTVVAALYGLLVAVSWLIPAGHALAEPLGLMSYAFMLIAAYATGDVADRLGVPRVTAYLMVGLAFGPHASELVTAHAVGATHHFVPGVPVAPFAILALGLAALRAGAGLRRDALRGKARIAAVTLGFTTAAVPLTVAAAVLAAVEFRLLVLPGAPREDLPAVLAAALVTGIVALGASPLATIGVLDETGGRGPVGALAHGLGLARELLAVTLTLVALALLPGTHVELHGLGLALSLVVGVLIAGAALAVRWVTRRETPTATLGIILGAGAALAVWAAPTSDGVLLWAAPWGPLLAFLVAGVVLGSAGRAGAGVLSAVAPLTTPAYVLFFTAVGAAFPVANAIAAIPLALAIAGARIAGVLIAARAVTRLGPSGLHASRGASGSLAFAGVSVALAYVVGDAAPGWGPVLRDALLGAILLSEVLGPVALRFMLRRAGEVAVVTDDGDEIAAAKRLLERDVMYGVDLPKPAADLPDELREPLLALRQRTQSEMELFAETLAEALALGPFAFVSEIAHASGDRAAALAAWYERCGAFAGRASTLEVLDTAVERLLANIDTAVGAIRPTSVAERPEDRRPRPGDSRLARARKGWRRALAAVGLRRRARRIVRLDRLAKFYLAMPLPPRLVPVANLALRAPVMALEEVRRTVLNREAPSVAAPENLLRLGDEVLARAMLLFADAMDALYDAVAKADTPSLPERLTNPSRRFQEYRAGRERLAADVARWDHLTRGYAGRLQALIQVELAEPRLAACYRDGADHLTTVLGGALVEPLAAMARGVDAALPEVEALLAAGTAPNPRALRAIGDRLRESAEASLRELDGRDSRGELSNLLAPMLADLDAQCHTLPERLVVPAVPGRLPAEGLAPSAEVEQTAELRAREIAVSTVVDDARLNLIDVEERVAALVGEARTAMSHALQLERFHLGAAADVLAARESANPEELAREFAKGGLERLQERLGEELRLLEAQLADIALPVLAEGERARAQLRTLLYEVAPAVAHAQVRRSRVAAVEAPVRTSRRVTAARWVVRRLTPLGGRGGDARRRATPRAGFPFEVAAQASLTSLAKLELPQSYLRLFSTNPLGVDEFFAGHEGPWATFEAALDRWQAGEPTAVVVVGGRGQGVSSLIERALRHLPAGTAVGRVPLNPRRESERELTRAIGAAIGKKRLKSNRRIEEHLVSLPTPLVLVIESLGRIQLRHRHGVDGLRLLRRLIGATAHKVLWIVGTDPLVLSAADGLVPLSRSFTHKVELGPLDAGQMARLIETRHQASGYRTQYADPNGGAASDQEDARERFFVKLAERAGGRPLIGVFEWLRALRMGEDGQTVLAELPDALDLSFVDRVPLNDLITLALVHVHDGLTPSELALVQRIPADDADEVLRRLAWRHIVEQTPSGDYAINPVIWPRLARRLRARGIA
ncbi:MAG: hypothetical protein CVU56_17070 [Deltaproteobacteria bacterium HGW-Deltaproteobacteria-14]|nr:MAG: hypothetical protein CVU56_17070 [Deltaproteobacteria bacterium HGW-Deltaproteobacteria-14]